MAYRRLDSSFWADSFHHELEPADAQRLQVLCTFLLLGPLATSVPGLICAGLAGLAERLRWPVAEVLEVMMLAGLVIDELPAAHQEAFTKASAKALGKPSRKASGKPLFRVDFRAQVVWISKGPSWAGKPESPNVVKGWSRHVGEVPDCRLKKDALASLHSYLSDRDKFRSEAFRKAFEKAFGEELPKGFQKAFTDRDRDRDHLDLDHVREEEITSSGGVPQKPPPPPSPAAPERAPPSLDQVARVLAAWSRGTKREKPSQAHPRAIAAIDARLAEGFTCEQLERAVEKGLPRHDWCMGRPLGRSEADDKHRAADPPLQLQIALNSGERVRELLELADQGERQAAARKNGSSNAQALPVKGEAPTPETAAALARVGIDVGKVASSRPGGG